MQTNTPSNNTSSELSALKSVWFWGAAIVLVIIVGGAWILFSRSLFISSDAVNSNNAVVLEPAAIAGHPAPDFELKNLDGETIRLADYQGKPVIINFWATWCGPCRAEMPEIQEISVENADDLIVIGVNNTATDNEDLIVEFVQEFGVTFPIVLDEDGKTVETYKVIGLPMTVFIDKDGVVNEVFTGPVNKAYIQSKIPEL